MTAKERQAVRGAYLLAAAAVRTEVKKMRKLVLAGVAVDAVQHTTLSAIAEHINLLAVASDDPPTAPDLTGGKR